MSDLIYRNETLRSVLQELGAKIPAASMLLAHEGRMAALEALSGHDPQICRELWGPDPVARRAV